MQWTVLVDGVTYGMFSNWPDAYVWVKTEWPVAFAQGTWRISEYRRAA